MDAKLIAHRASLRPTMNLKFINGKLHQQWVNDNATAYVWLLVPSEVT